MKVVNIIGAGLAGSEAAYQLAKRNILVKLYEMRPIKTTDAHETDLFAELVCSNSLRAKGLENAVGLLKEEMRLLDSLIVKAALATSVEAGGALAVDRLLFPKYITKVIKSHPNIEVIHEEVTQIPNGPTIIATGPLTSDQFSECIKSYFGEDHLYFYDAVAPIISAESIDMNKVFLQSRYDKGEPSYLNCPMTEEEFNRFYDFLTKADCVLPKDFEMKVFDGCLPVEDIAKRGRETLLYGPMKPVGLTNPHNKKKPYAVVQLRQDNIANTMYNLVGFQTHLKWGEQKRLLELIPGLENAEIIRYGVMHKNTYINSPSTLKTTFQTKERDDLFFAGQITGVEGYVESAASGLVAGINMARFLFGELPINLDHETAIGSLGNYISNSRSDYFNPMNVNYGIFKPLEEKHHKRDRKRLYYERSMRKITDILRELGDSYYETRSGETV